ncbi:GerAB/ArcD/ProY family transporter [Peribacillus loiseleuriae]|uniref:Spore gernimation protein KB n=1 Tax=Peribacillus loiseleuriae TaxID=1679170 RepID=A0A0K9GQG1_9BACI|nr:GerAB/ArcD/ProY family transporter [Peribacillus loiseleuriae]KMY48836.1 spore gernimation protein KB [Peribacillus loiseleuriae]
MEKAKISAYQLFVLIVLFEVGSTLLIPLALDAKQDAWLTILLGMVGGFFLFLVNFRLFHYYPDILPTEYMQKIVGKSFGKFLAFLYILYFMYMAAKVVRDFGEMLITSTYPQTPLFIIIALFLVVIIYTIRKGIEVVARTGELLFLILLLLGISGTILIAISGIVDLKNLLPVLEEGIMPVLKTTFTQTLYIPFGEAVVFSMILPYLNQSKKGKRIGVYALGFSGLALTLVVAINISVLGVNLTARSQFPLLSTIQTIQIDEFLERLDVYFMLTLILGGFFKISLYFYVAVAGIANLFNFKEPSRLVYPMGIVILILSITIASNYAEHISEGTRFISLRIFLPFQVIIPVSLLIIAFFKHRKKRGK